MLPNVQKYIPYLSKFKQWLSYPCQKPLLHLLTNKNTHQTSSDKHAVYTSWPGGKCCFFHLLKRGKWQVQPVSISTTLKEKWGKLMSSLWQHIWNRVSKNLGSFKFPQQKIFCICSYFQNNNGKSGESEGTQYGNFQCVPGLCAIQKWIWIEKANNMHTFKLNVKKWR